MNKDYIIHEIENIFKDNDISIDKKFLEADTEIKEFVFNASAISSKEFDSLHAMITKLDLEVHIKWEFDTSWVRIELFDKI